MKSFTSKQKDFLKKPFLANISIIHSKTNLPIVFPAWVLEDENKLYLTTGLESKKIKHLKKNNSIGLNVVDPSGFPYIGVSGKVKLIQKSEQEKFSRLREKMMAKYDPNGDFRARMANNPNQMERILVEIEPDMIFGGIK